MLATTLLQSESLQVLDYRCNAGPHVTPFVEHHERFSISYVRSGSFGCITRGRRFELVCGSIMFGHPGDEYMCTHEHHRRGDECLSFQLAPELVATLGAGSAVWQSGALPPLPELMMLGELAQAAGDGHNDVGLDEAGMLLAARFIEIVSGRGWQATKGTARDRRRAVRAALWLDAHSSESVDLQRAAQESAVSTFHFLRLFTRVTGVTPHQYLVRSRLRRAARLLAPGWGPIAEVAFEVGYGDLSNFIRTFRRAAGVSPGQFRRTAKGERKILQDRLATPVLD